MRTDNHGVSTCPRGQEQHEEFKLFGQTRVQYDYRTVSGVLFSGVFKSLDEARQAKARWLLKTIA